jgi:ligand-binding sensor domain-containing protein
MIIVSDLFSTTETSLVDTRIVLPTTIPDTEYEQVIAQRYLFAPFANESTAWPVLTNIHNVWQVVSLPQYHPQAAEEFWLLTETITDTQSTNSTAGTLQMSWMSLSTNSTSVVLPEIDIKSFLAVSHNKATAMTYTAALISLGRVQLILCNEWDAVSCRIIKSIPFPSVLSNTLRITASLFIDDLGATGWLYIATNTGLHGLDLSTFIIIPYINQINVSVSSLAWSSKHHTIFAGTETKLWIHSYGAGGEGWRFEHITGLIDAPITSLVYNDVQDKLWIGQPKQTKKWKNARKRL